MDRMGEVPLLPEVNEKVTIKRAKKKLGEYPRWREIAESHARVYV